MDPCPCAPHYQWLRIQLEDLAVICQYGSVENPEHRGITRTWPINSPKGAFSYNPKHLTMTGDIFGYHIGKWKESYWHLGIQVKDAAECHTVYRATPLQRLIHSNAQTEPRLRNGDTELWCSLEPPRSLAEMHRCFGSPGAWPKKVHL